jgi:formylglycine-generating enzyme required for sulfatase activity
MRTSMEHSKPWSALLRQAAFLSLVLSSLLAGGCGGQTGSLVQNVSIIVANYLVVDLVTGDVEPLSAVPNIATSSEYRRTKMVFRAVPAGSSGLGSSPGTFCAQGDEIPTAASVPKFYIGVFEVTQGQWQLLTGTTPWTTVNPPSVVGGIIANPDAPAFNIDYNSAVQAISTFNANLGVQFDLPTDVQWEFACRAGSAGLFSWGSSRSDLVAQNHAYVAETVVGVAGPHIVGSKAANGLGLFDMHGNVWEMTKGGSIRGGSWSDTLPQARCANKIVLDPRRKHGLVGLRLVIIP